MAERGEIVGQAIIAENGPLKTIATYYHGHMPLESLKFLTGQHVEGFTGPETRVQSKVLMASRTFEVVGPNPLATPVESAGMMPNQEVYVG